jgi:hypothetical protein
VSELIITRRVLLLSSTYHFIQKQHLLTPSDNQADHMATHLARLTCIATLLASSTHAFHQPASSRIATRAIRGPSSGAAVAATRVKPPMRGPVPLRLGAVEEALAGIFFPLSLPPYLAFLYWAGYAPNQMPKLALFGFQVLRRERSKKAIMMMTSPGLSRRVRVRSYAKNDRPVLPLLQCNSPPTCNSPFVCF